MVRTQPPLNLDDPMTWKGVDKKNCLAWRLKEIRYNWDQDPQGYKVKGKIPMDRCRVCAVPKLGILTFVCDSCMVAMAIGDEGRDIRRKFIEAINEKADKVREVESGPLDNFRRADQL